MDAFITWSGWVIAIGLALFTAIQTWRNRSATNVDIELMASDNTKNIRVTLKTDNKRYMFYVTSIGFELCNGKYQQYTASLNAYAHPMYKGNPWTIDINLDVLKNISKEQNAVVKYVWINGPTRERHKGKIAKGIKHMLTN